jgi:predicted DNA binding CopG/RHH family protein
MEGKQMSKLTDEEKTIEQAVISGKYKPVPKAKWSRYQRAATETMKKIARINIRMKTDDLEGIKQIADRKGMPYQTLIGSVLHRFAKGDMISIDDAEQVERFKDKLAV